MDIVAVLVAPDDPHTVLVGGGQGGLLRSTDGARTFTRVHDAGVGALAADPTGDDRMLALTSRGVEESSDAGQTWTLVGRPDVTGRLVTVAAGAEGRVWLLSEEPRALPLSSDGGSMWQTINTDG